MPAYPKHKQLGRQVVDSKQFRKLTESEKHLQAQCEMWLEVQKIPFLRIPDAAYHLLVKNPKYCSEASRYLKGIPDLTIFNPNGNGYNDTLCIELKVGKNKASGGQKAFARRVNVIIIRDFETFTKTVTDFINGKPLEGSNGQT